VTEEELQLNHSVPTPVTPSKKSFFKKAIKEDGMDKVLDAVNFEEKFSSLPQYTPTSNTSPSALPASPQHLFMPNYCLKRNAAMMEDDLGSEASATPRTPRTPQSQRHATHPAHPTDGRLHSQVQPHWQHLFWSGFQSRGFQGK